MCYEQRWRAVHARGWSTPDTLVACRQLGISTSDYSHSEVDPGLPETLRFDQFGCSGSESTLLGCHHVRHDDSTTGPSSHPHIVSISCGTADKDVTFFPTTTVLPTTHSLPSSDSDDRLVFIVCFSVVCVALLGVTALLAVLYIRERKGNTQERWVGQAMRAMPQTQNVMETFCCKTLNHQGDQYLHELSPSMCL